MFLDANSADLYHNSIPSFFRYPYVYMSVTPVAGLIVHICRSFGFFELCSLPVWVCVSVFHS